MMLYKFYPLKTALLNIESKKLKISIISELNDPFEFEPYSFSSKEERLLWGRIRKKISSMFGLISFCEVWNNPLLWSHYADDHQGLCFGFEVAAELAEKVRYFRYKSPLNSIQTFIDKGDEQAMRYALTTKFSHWKYEREQRVFSSLNEAILSDGMYFEPFSDSIRLVSVFIGVRASISSEEIRKFVGPNVQIVTARQAFRSFLICEQKDTSLMK